MSAGKWKMYEEAKLALANSEIDFENDAFEIALYLSTSNANDLTGAKNLATLTNQVATAFGYTQADGAAGGKVLAVTSGNTSGTIKIDGDDPIWTANGGPITGRTAVIIDGSHASNIAVGVMLLESPAADVTATDGNTFKITQNVSGMFAISGAAVD